MNDFAGCMSISEYLGVNAKPTLCYICRCVACSFCVLVSVSRIRASDTSIACAERGTARIAFAVNCGSTMSGM